MSENILVVEYEPRYIDRVRQALAGQPVTVSYAKDGEEALRLLGDVSPRLIVLSSVIPKMSTPDLIRAIRERNPLDNTPILLTVSGYKGTAPKQDAVRHGVTDILPKPFTEADFLDKVKQILGSEGFHAPAPALTSNEIFGDLVDVPVPAPKRTASDASIDKMLADTLSGVMPKKGATSPGTVLKPKTLSGNLSFDKMIEDTLSGLEKNRKPPPHAAAPLPAAAPARPAPAPALAPTPLPVTPVVKVEEEEPTDGVRFGQYVLLEKIATGGMAEVWKARKRGEEGFQKIVAIKKILPHLSDDQEFIGMFVDEAKLAAQLNHSNIIHIYDLGKIQSSYFIAMEYVDGADLKTIVSRGRERDQPLGVELALFVTTKVASALDYAHRKRDFDEKEMELVHRDVSPQNVLISHEGDIKLCDFGIAKATSKGSHTQAGALKGKLQYMSPEQAWGRAIDRRSDIFALAVVLFEMLTQRKLFTGDNEMSVLEQVREARVVAPSEINDEVPPEVDRIVLKGLAKDPADRYQTAGEMAKDIDSVLYSFRPTPTSADLAIYMHRLWIAEPQSMHTLEPLIEISAPAPPAPPPVVTAPPKPAPLPVPVPVTVATTSSMPAWDAPSTHLSKKRSFALSIIIVAVLLAAAAGAFFFMKGRGAATPQTASVAPSPVSSTPSETGTLVPATDTSSTMALVPDQTTVAPQDTSIDPNLINQEVQKRLAAERARLDEQARAQAAAAAAPVQRAPSPQQQSATQTTAPVTQPPAADTRAAEPEPPPPLSTETSVAQPAVEAAPQRVREGDLVPVGTEGLVPAKVLRRATVAYPPMARAQKVQGTVICSVLVSETGEVLDVRVLRGVARSAGLNEAAQTMMRRSTFTPPTKDGVRVKAWTTVPVDFKL
ncbi:MAG: TonB family protein [Thermoanaerobaculia bacterium]|nr:TonB family protein [Thermoanaerobaculia bacterium]